LLREGRRGRWRRRTELGQHGVQILIAGLEPDVSNDGGSRSGGLQILPWIMALLLLLNRWRGRRPEGGGDRRRGERREEGAAWSRACDVGGACRRRLARRAASIGREGTAVAAGHHGDVGGGISSFSRSKVRVTVAFGPTCSGLLYVGVSCHWRRLMHLRHVPPRESHGKENCTRPGPVSWLVGPQSLFSREGCPQ
jgi:hypothetical protein